MAATILLLLQDADAHISLTLSVPSTYTFAEVLQEIIEASELDCTDAAGGFIRYILVRKSTSQVMSPHTTLAQAGVLHGDSLVVYDSRNYPAYTQTPVSLPAMRAMPTADRKPARTRAQDAALWAVVLRWQASGAYEDALLRVLEHWQTTYGAQSEKQVLSRAASMVTMSFARATPTTDPAASPAKAGTEELDQLLAYIGRLLVDAVREQIRRTDFDAFYRLLQAETTKAFFAAYPAWQTALIEMLLQASYVLGERRCYEDARYISRLALLLDPQNEAATQLEALAHNYIVFQTTSDPEERLELARLIYQMDKDYGGIAADLRATIQQNRAKPEPAKIEPAQSVPAYTPAVIPPAWPTPPVASPPPKQPRRRAIQFPAWVSIVFLLLFLIVIIIFIASLT